MCPASVRGRGVCCRRCQPQVHSRVDPTGICDSCRDDVVVIDRLLDDLRILGVEPAARKIADELRRNNGISDGHLLNSGKLLLKGHARRERCSLLVACEPLLQPKDGDAMPAATGPENAHWHICLDGRPVRSCVGPRR